jgi:hypothetical protein
MKAIDDKVDSGIRELVQVYIAADKYVVEDLVEMVHDHLKSLCNCSQMSDRDVPFRTRY